MKRPDPMTIAAGLAIAAGLTQNLDEGQLLFLFLVCVCGIGVIYVSEIFRLTK